MAGKSSKPRLTDWNKYRSNYNRIFGSEQEVKKRRQDAIENSDEKRQQEKILFMDFDTPPEVYEWRRMLRDQKRDIINSLRMYI